MMYGKFFFFVIKTNYYDIIYICRPGGMVDALDSKSSDSNIMRVQVPRPVPKCKLNHISGFYFIDRFISMCYNLIRKYKG
jgi:hypothetical protein